MADRFVNGYTVSNGALSGLVGSHSVSGAGLLAEVDADLVEEITMTLDLEEQDLAALLDAIVRGDLDPEQAYEYARALEIILNARARRLDPSIEVLLTYYLPNDSFGRWNPVLSALGLTALARAWALPNLHFPWRAAAGRKPVDWPTATGLTPVELTGLRDELAASAWRDALRALDGAYLSDRDPAFADDAREELALGLETLSAWIDVALSRNEGLVLWMDGDQ